MQKIKVAPFVLALIGLCLFGPMRAELAVAQTGNTPQTPAAATNKPTFWIIPHTHWEGAVFKTREEYLEVGLPNILTALRLLKENPDYRFTLDQVAYFKPFLERYPEEAAAFRKFVAEGRLQIVCGLDIMPDVNMPSGESLVRQILYAKGYCRDVLGVDVKVGWFLDTFGHHGQMPQVLKLAGYNSFWFHRGMVNPDKNNRTMTRFDRVDASRDENGRPKTPSEFLWQGIDGTRIPAFFLPQSYAVLHSLPSDLPHFTIALKRHYDSLAPFSPSVGDRVGLAGADVTEPKLFLPALVEQFNRQPDMPFTLRIGVPTDFEAVVAKRADLPVITGERNPLFQGIYSSRIELKQWMRNMERLLTTAEQFGALANWLGTPQDDAMTWRAWEPSLFNVTHDLASGVMTDRVYEDTVRSYEFSKRLADELIATRLGSVVARIDTRGEGVPLAVFNTLGWPRTDVAQGDVGFAEGGVMDFEVSDSAGKIVPAQILETASYADGGLKRIKFAFVARDVPALGYSLYRVVPRRAAGESKASVTDTNGGNVLENGFYRANVDLATGALTNLVVKAGDWEALKSPGNIVARETDEGDFWELNRSLDGGQAVMVTSPLNVPQPGQAQFSTDERATNGAVRRGPVFSEFEVRHPFGLNSFATTVRLYDGIPRLEFTTQILNNEQHVRYRLLVPTAITNGKNFHEIPFGAMERPTEQEFPAQNWIDYSDSNRGVALLNRGLPGNNVAEGTLMLSLMRATHINNYGGPDFKKDSTDTGFELGQERTFHYALLPHAGDWRDAGVSRAGMEFNHPLIVQKVAPHAGSLPKRWGLIEISQSNVMLSAFKPGKDGTAVLRVYETDGRAANGVQVKLNATVLSANDANLMEDAGAKLDVQNNTLRFDLHPFEIKTFTLRLETLPADK